jgi:hypothetical protein
MGTQLHGLLHGLLLLLLRTQLHGLLHGLLLLPLRTQLHGLLGTNREVPNFIQLWRRLLKESKEKS